VYHGGNGPNWHLACHPVSTSPGGCALRAVSAMQLRRASCSPQVPEAALVFLQYGPITGIPRVHGSLRASQKTMPLSMHGRLRSQQGRVILSCLLTSLGPGGRVVPFCLSRSKVIGPPARALMAEVVASIESIICLVALTAWGVWTWRRRLGHLFYRSRAVSKSHSSDLTERPEALENDRLVSAEDSRLIASQELCTLEVELPPISIATGGVSAEES